MNDKGLNGLYFVLNLLCNIGLFILIYSIFLANLDALQVYGREMAIGVRTGTFWSELTKAEIWRAASLRRSASLASRKIITQHCGAGNTNFSRILPVLDFKKP